MNIYVGNFSYDITEEELKALFEEFGQVGKTQIVKDKFSGGSRGFGFVEMANKNEAEAAIQGITEIKGRRITINEARPQVKDNFWPSKKDGSGRSDGYARERRY